MISADVIKKLVEVEKANHPLDQSIDAVLRSLKKYDGINRLAPEDWYEVARPMPGDELVALIRGLTVAEQHHGWTGGSVSAVIWTFRELQRGNPALANEVANWVLSNTNNPYLPFGSQNYGARTLREYLASNDRHQYKIRLGLQEQAESEARAASERDTRAEQRSASSRDRNAPIRQEIAEGLEVLPLIERLEKIASDPTYSVKFFPTSWADAADVQLMRDLSSSVRMALLTKLKGQQRGPWAKFKKRLLDIEALHWNRKPWFR